MPVDQYVYENIIFIQKKVKIRRQLRGTYVHLFFEAFKCSVSRDFFLPDFSKKTTSSDLKAKLFLTLSSNFQLCDVIPLAVC